MQHARATLSPSVLNTWLVLALALGLGGLALLLGVGWHLAFEGHRRIGLSVGRSDLDTALLFDLALLLVGSLATAWGWLIARNVEWVRARQATLARASMASSTSSLVVINPRSSAT